MKSRKKPINLFIIIMVSIVLLEKRVNMADNTNIFGDFYNIFISVLAEAIPFILLGSFISALIQRYVSKEFIKKIIPENIILAYFEMALLGIIMPVCECAIVPIARRLIKKGMPVGLGVTFMLAVPIVNPIVILSTYYAFHNLSIVILRVLGGMVCSILIGVIMNILYEKDQNIVLDGSMEINMCNCGCEDDQYYNIFDFIKHIVFEFLEITKYLIYGALLSTCFQILSSKYNAFLFKGDSLCGILFMMSLGFLLSLCSEADAFVAAEFLEIQGICACLGFLLLGPMLDLKNLIILLGVFKKKFVVTLLITTVITIFSICVIFSNMGF